MGFRSRHFGLALPTDGGFGTPTFYDSFTLLEYVYNVFNYLCANYRQIMCYILYLCTVSLFLWTILLALHIKKHYNDR